MADHYIVDASNSMQLCVDMRLTSIRDSRTPRSFVTRAYFSLKHEIFEMISTENSAVCRYPWNKWGTGNARTVQHFLNVAETHLTHAGGGSRELAVVQWLREMVPLSASELDAHRWPTAAETWRRRWRLWQRKSTRGDNGRARQA
jgi:hypothetical protein